MSRDRLPTRSALVTDDAHVGTIGRQRGVNVWDLPLLLTAAIRVGAIGSVDELSEIVESLRCEDGYRFSAADEESLFEEF